MSNNLTPTYDEVYSAARAWHYTFVRRLADQEIAEIGPEDLEPGRERREWLDDWLSDACDCDRALYNGPAHLLIFASDNDDAYASEFGDEVAKPSHYTIELSGPFEPMCGRPWKLVEMSGTSNLPRQGPLASGLERAKLGSGGLDGKDSWIRVRVHFCCSLLYRRGRRNPGGNPGDQRSPQR